MAALKSFVGFVGRACFSLFFLAGGIQAFLHWQEAEQMLTLKLHNWVTLYLGHPTWQNLLEWELAHVNGVFFVQVVLQLIGGVLLFVGMGVRLGALCLLLYLLPQTVLDHYFWLLNPTGQAEQVIPFLQQLSLIGALLFFLAIGKGTKRVRVVASKGPKSDA